MTEEKAIYVTAERKTRAALEAARYALVTDSGLSAFCDDAPNEIFRIDNKNAIQQIDDALAMGSPDIMNIMHQTFPELRLKQQILEMPDQIGTQSMKVAAIASEVEDLRFKIAQAKNDALALVLEATENGKPKFSNEKARALAQELFLKENTTYLECIDELGRKETTLRVEQINLETLHNRFRAYLAIAGMRGVR